MIPALVFTGRPASWGRTGVRCGPFLYLDDERAGFANEAGSTLFTFNDNSYDTCRSINQASIASSLT